MMLVLKAYKQFIYLYSVIKTLNRYQIMDVAKLLANAKKKKDEIKNRDATIKPKPGLNRYVLLPDWNKERSENFFVAFSQHFIKDYGKLTQDGKPEMTVHVCMSGTFGEECPICDAISEAGRLISSTATDEQIKTLEEAKAGTGYLMNVLEVDEHGKHDGQPKILQLGKLALGSILEMMEDWGEAIFVEHQVVQISREGTGLNTKYTVLPGSKKIAVDQEVIDRATDLDDYIKQANEEKKRLALNAIRAAAGIPTTQTTHIPAERSIGMSSADATDVSFKEVGITGQVAEIVDIDDELDNLLNNTEEAS